VRRESREPAGLVSVLEEELQGARSVAPAAKLAVSSL